jgi:23S rRNA (cytidine1920-2'-O)/16S rRNA (cytidine1409-2'-O)-methyltransferase
MPKKLRLDQALLERGLAETRNKAQALIMAGEVRVAGQVRTKPGEMIPTEAEIAVIGALPYASRGGYKLAHGLDSFELNPTGMIAMDVGASTGGFTDVLLQRGARQVVAVDVGYGLLDWKLRQDARVTVLERTNIRYLESLPPAPNSGEPMIAECATIDVAFISLKLVLPAVQALITPQAWVVALIKPQFEAGAAEVDRGAGVIRDPQIHAQILHDILGYAASLGLMPHGLVRSPITGPAGNIEFLAWLGGPGPLLAVDSTITTLTAF